MKGVIAIMEQLRGKWGKKDKESVIFLLLLFVMAIYYGWRLFALTPWYDELYTYYYFISRGPIYAAIHWPLPNNHVGYSVLSAILGLFGNAAVGLRGISWISSLVSLCLLYAIGRKFFSKSFALMAVCFYAAMSIVNQYAVQGRGYALASCLYLAALYELIQIVAFHEKRWRHYVIMALSFIWALYTLPSSVYFVVPLCVIGGGWLLMEKRGRELARLFFTALISALCTAMLYAIIWLAIGSNLLSKIPDGPCYKQGHIDIILHAPFNALKTGMEYMLDTPYIQSVPREGYLPRFADWIKALYEYYYPGLSVALLALTGIGIVAIAAFLVKRLVIQISHKSMPVSGQGKDGFLAWYLLMSFALTPLMLIIQAALPYYRVFSYFGVPVALLFTWLLVRATGKIQNRSLVCAVATVLALLCMLRLCRKDAIAEYGEREAAVADVCKQIEYQDNTIVCVTDCDQEYLIKYLYGREDVTKDPYGADYIILDKLLFLEGEEFAAVNSADFWKYYISHDNIPWEYLEEKTEISYENDMFILYRRNKE